MSGDKALKSEEGFFECRNHVNCGDYASANGELCESCEEEREDYEDLIPLSNEQAQAIKKLKESVAFFKKVSGAAESEKIAVGTDHFEMLEKAAFAVDQAFPYG